MIIVETKKLQDSCKKILMAVDSQNNQLVSEVIELKSEVNILYLNITNKEYYVSLPIVFEEALPEFHAVVNAKLLLNLIAKVTSKEISFDIDGNVLLVKANGSYKLPMIYDGDSMVELISLKPINVVSECEIDRANLQSIVSFNTLELLKPALSTVEQRLFYIDEEGCVTFGTGACINSFSLATPMKLLLNDKVVKLFKLFNGDMIKISLGYDPISDDLFLTKVGFTDGSISVFANITANNTSLNTFPATYLREHANFNFPYNMVVNRLELLDSISRLKLFNNGNDVFTPITINPDSLVVFDMNKNNSETIQLQNVINMEEPYECVFQTKELETILKSIKEDYLTVKFGDHSKGIVIERGNIKNILPEAQ